MSGALLCWDGRRAVGADELRPNKVPVIGPQAPTHNSATGGHFDRHASADRHRPGLACPLPYELRIDTEALSQFGLLAVALVNEFMEFHETGL